MIMNKINSIVYPQKMTFFPFGEGHIVGFLNETVVENWKQPGAPDDAEPITGYQYSGPREDGGTLMPCDDPENYGEVANAIIRSQYPESEEMAIHRHHGNDPEGYAQEWGTYNQFCEHAKELAKQWLGID